MSKESKKFAKRKEREREVQKKLLAKRARNQHLAREEKRQSDLEHAFRRRQKPICNEEERAKRALLESTLALKRIDQERVTQALLENV